ncbi:MAG TPA: transcription termination/antitermination NusG family protein [Anaerolineaceae bacterium]
MAAYWYAIQSKPNKEDALYKQLQSQNFDVFYPRIKVQPVNPRAKKIKAYFPGYMFVRTDLQAVGLSTFQWMPFARGMVTFDQEPATVPDPLIIAIRRRVEEVNVAGGELFDGLKKGDTVLIHDGPFAGYEAIFDVRLSGSERVRVLIKLLSQRQVPLELGAGQIHQAPKHDDRNKDTKR